MKSNKYKIKVNFKISNTIELPYLLNSPVEVKTTIFSLSTAERPSYTKQLTVTLVVHGTHRPKFSCPSTLVHLGSSTEEELLTVIELTVVEYAAKYLLAQGCKASAVMLPGYYGHCFHIHYQVRRNSDLIIFERSIPFPSNVSPGKCCSNAYEKMTDRPGVV